MASVRDDHLDLNAVVLIQTLDLDDGTGGELRAEEILVRIVDEGTDTRHVSDIDPGGEHVVASTAISIEDVLQTLENHPHPFPVAGHRSPGRLVDPAQPRHEDEVPIGH